MRSIVQLASLMSLAGILITERERKIWVTDTEEEVMGRWSKKLEQCISRKPSNAKVCWQLPETRREEWKELTLRASRRNQPCWHAGLQNWERTSLLFKATWFVAICYGSSGKLIKVETQTWLLGDHTLTEILHRTKTAENLDYRWIQIRDLSIQWNYHRSSTKEIILLMHAGPSETCGGDFNAEQES